MEPKHDDDDPLLIAAVKMLIVNIYRGGNPFWEIGWKLRLK